jgi:hypothetical protein
VWHVELTFLGELPRCLAHIINLATQAIISVRTKSKYYNGDPTDDHIPEDIGDNERDEIGIIWAICIKVYSVSFQLVLSTNLRILCRCILHPNIRKHSRASNFAKISVLLTYSLT